MGKVNSAFDTKEFLEKIFENSEDGIAIVDKAGNFLGVNPAFANIYGYSEKELKNMHISQLANKEELSDKFLEKHLIRLHEKGGVKFEELTNLKKGGTKIFVETSYTFLKDDDGNYSCGLIITRDISNRKGLERELKESEEKYRNLFDTANDGVLIADKNNKIISINKRAGEMLGYIQEELIGKPATIIMPARYQKVDENAMKRVHSTGQSFTVGKTYEIEMVRKDGMEIPVEATYSVSKIGDNFTFTMIFRDISERKNLEARLIQSERLHALGDMASGIAHDFNNLLATILGRVQLLKFKIGSYQENDRRISTKYLLEGLEIIEKAATDGAGVVKRVQEFTRIKTDTQNFCEININELVKDVIEYSRPQLKEVAEIAGKEIDIVKHFSKTLPPARGNPSELREVLINIIKNSIDAMPQGGTISINTSQENGHIVLSITDTGCGIPRSIKGKIFEPFFTTKGPKRMGLGMSVSYGIIKRHQGDITVKSEEGKGTCTTIQLPIAKETGGKKGTATQPPAEEKKARILVIDDEAGIRKLLSELLETAGHDVTVASDGEEGLKLFKDGFFDMVFTDLGMPGISGWEVAKQIKELNAQIPVTLITGWGIQVDEEKKRIHRVDFIINKPFNIDEVVSLVREGMLKTHP